MYIFDMIHMIFFSIIFLLKALPEKKWQKSTPTYQDSHELVATALAECDEPAEPMAAVNGRRLEDALTGGGFSMGRNPS